MVAVSKEPSSNLDAFVEELGAKYPIVGESTDSMRAYGRTSYPSAFLIGPDGRIAWEGHPGSLGESTVEDLVATAKVLPAIPDALKGAGRDLERSRYGAALADVESALEKGRLEGDDLVAAEAIRDWLTWYATSSMENAARDLEAGRVYEAAVTYETVEDLYKGHELQKQAAAALKDLLSDADRKLEVKAGEKLAKVLAEIASDHPSPKETMRLLQPLLGHRYEHTRAGQRAAEMAKELEPDVR